MHSRSGGRGGGLTQALDRHVTEVVRRILDDNDDDANDYSLSVAQVYDTIKSSTSSLHRKPKKLLEESIERVLQNFRQDITSSAELDNMNRIIRTQISAANSAPPVPLSHRQNPLPTETAVERDAVQLQVKRRQADHEPQPKRRKTTTAAVDRSPPTNICLANLGGVADIVEELVDFAALPLLWPTTFKDRDNLTQGLLIHGPPGCGKTTIVNAFAAELGVNYIPIPATSIIMGTSGESEKALRDLFEEAKKCAPCLMFIDEIDAISLKRETIQREMEKRIVSQLAMCMDSLSSTSTSGSPVIVLAATNRPDSLDGALRRPGRFGTEIHMTVPTEAAREKIIRALTRTLTLTPDFDFASLARITPGFVGADLHELVSKAQRYSRKRCRAILQSQADNDSNEANTDEPVSSTVHPETASSSRLVRYLRSANEVPMDVQPTFDDFLAARRRITPTCMREGFATIPSTTFDDIGSLSSQITELRDSIISPILNPTSDPETSDPISSGVLLWGPPGTGKTLLAKAIANSSHANFILINGPELLSKYVGDSEKAVRQLFARARSSVPVIIFIDEMDSLTPVRENMSEASSRVVSTLLTELDGTQSNREGVFVIAATNRPDAIDPALLRPGRIDTSLFVGLPDAEGRVDILRKLCKRLKDFAFTEEMADIARSCERFSGADLRNLLRVARLQANKRHEAPVEPQGSWAVSATDFRIAQDKVKPSVSVESLKHYHRLEKEYGSTPRA